MALRVRRPARLGHTTPTLPLTPHRTASMCLLATTRSKGHHRPLCAHRGPGRTRRGSRAASMPVPVTTLVVAGLYLRRHALLDHISLIPGNRHAYLPLPGTTSTHPARPSSLLAHLGHTTPTPDRAHRWTALTPVLVTTWTNLVKGGRHLVPLGHTTPTLDPAHPRTAFSPVPGTMCQPKVPAHRQNALKESTNHRPVSLHAYGLHRVITLTRGHHPARQLARLASTSPTLGRVAASSRAGDTSSHQRHPVIRRPAPPELTTPMRARWLQLTAWKPT